MKKYALLLLMALLPLLSWADGVEFKNGSWADMIALAKSQNKLLFVDVYATWCGPCKLLDKNTFPDKALGDYYNTHFINFKLDGEKGDGPKVMETYKINGFPTLLFVDPANEQLVYTTSGYTTPDKFLEYGEIATRIFRNKKSPEDIEKIVASKSFTKEALEDYIVYYYALGKPTAPLLKAYIATIAGNSTPNDLYFMFNNMSHLDDELINYYMTEQKKHGDKAFKYGDNDEQWLGRIYYKELQTAIQDKNPAGIDRIEKYAKKYPGSVDLGFGATYYRYQYAKKVGTEKEANAALRAYASELATVSDQQLAMLDKASYEGSIKGLQTQLKEMGIPESDWEEKIKATVASNPEIVHSTTLGFANSLNSIAWEVVEQKRSALYKEALGWSKRSFEMVQNSPPYFSAIADTYAHLLYLNGDKEQAISIQILALEQADEQEKATYSETLNKMKAGTL